MNLSVNLEGIQENKKYILEFCIRADGKTIRKIEEIEDEIDEPLKKKSSKQKENKMPSLDDIESSREKEFKMPKIEEPIFDRSKMKVETSFGDKRIGET